MGGGKETPRQKMIGMMYLVLTALLAMNVSKQILHGYVAVNESIEVSKENLHENNERVFKSFEEMAVNTAAAKPYLEKAKEAQKEIMIVYNYLEVLRNKIVAFVEKPENPKSADTMKLSNLEKNGQIDNYDLPTNMLIGSEASTPIQTEFTAYELKGKLNGLYKNLVGILDAMQKNTNSKLPKEDYESLKKKLGSIKPDETPFDEDGVKFGWEAKNFYHLPEAAVVTTMNKMQADLKNIEADILQVFSGASGKLAIKFDHLEAKVIAPSSYIQAGQPYTADIFLAASSSKLGAGDLEVLLGADSASTAGGTPIPIEGGMGKYSAPTGGQGEQTYKGVIKFKKPDGSFDRYPFSGTYVVAAPSLAVSAEQMKVFYVGVVNPVLVSAAGIAPTDLQVSANGGGAKYVSKGGGKFDFTFTTPGECTITGSSKSKPQGSSKFKVKPLPKPELKLAGAFSPQTLTKGQASQIAGLGAGANGFEFQANFVVIGWEVTAKNKGKLVQKEGSGNNLDSEAQGFCRGADVGSKVYIDAKVKGPDGKTNSVTCAFKITK